MFEEEETQPGDNLYIDSQRDTTIGGDVTGRDKISTIINNYYISGELVRPQPAFEPPLVYQRNALQQIVDHLRNSGEKKMSLLQLARMLSTDGLRDGINEIYEPLSLEAVTGAISEFMTTGKLHMDGECVILQESSSTPSIPIDSRSTERDFQLKAKFSFKNLVRTQTRHEYLLVAKIESHSATTINSYKLQFTFPDIGMFISHRTYTTNRNHIVFSQDTDNNFLVTYNSARPLFPREEVDLTDEIAWKYQVNDEIYMSIRSIGQYHRASLDWKLYADNISPQIGSIQLSTLHQY